MYLTFSKIPRARNTVLRKAFSTTRFFTSKGLLLDTKWIPFQLSLESALRNVTGSDSVPRILTGPRSMIFAYSPMRTVTPGSTSNVSVALKTTPCSRM